MLDTESIERASVYTCVQIFSKSNFIFREQSIADHGIDAIIETKEESAQQVK